MCPKEHEPDALISLLVPIDEIRARLNARGEAAEGANSDEFHLGCIPRYERATEMAIARGIPTFVFDTSSHGSSSVELAGITAQDVYRLPA